ncbi:PREDICTED: chloroplastic lipocalin [Prunus dulcis]|uniref:PREDICTED: chloroplastic lipocalin n=1 Tax=Prunus dulcis TaxID=3755 RepID=A0A5E4G6G6_PRUDU|nr:PREDICTED: chloroplastic lipocalin [Prunus dulcis]
MLFSRIVCDATSIQGATDSVENFPLLDILEGDPKCLARPSMVPACLIEIALQVAIQIILKATSFVLSFHVSLLGVYTYDMETPSIQVDTFCVNGGPDGIY